MGYLVPQSVRTADGSQLVVSGASSAGKVLTGGGAGLASWQTPGGGGGGEVQAPLWVARLYRSDDGAGAWLAWEHALTDEPGCGAEAVYGDPELGNMAGNLDAYDSLYPFGFTGETGLFCSTLRVALASAGAGLVELSIGGSSGGGGTTACVYPAHPGGGTVTYALTSQFDEHNVIDARAGGGALTPGAGSVQTLTVVCWHRNGVT